MHKARYDASLYGNWVTVYLSFQPQFWGSSPSSNDRSNNESTSRGFSKDTCHTLPPVLACLQGWLHTKPIRRVKGSTVQKKKHAYHHHSWLVRIIRSADSTTNSCSSHFQLNQARWCIWQLVGQKTAMATCRSATVTVTVSLSIAFTDFDRFFTSNKRNEQKRTRRHIKHSQAANNVGVYSLREIQY